MRLLGNPDFTFPKEKLAVFVDGCFWHGCSIHGNKPKSNRDYWERKLSRNRKRDRRVTRELRKSGWRVIRVWEHSLNDTSKVVARIRRALETAQSLA
jgi:DNA mismatch endonuclease (patch repair protein)